MVWFQLDDIPDETEVQVGLEVRGAFENEASVEGLSIVRGEGRFYA